jgi:hypothetical protein
VRSTTIGAGVGVVCYRDDSGEPWGVRLDSDVEGWISTDADEFDHHEG